MEVVTVHGGSDDDDGVVVMEAHGVDVVVVVHGGGDGDAEVVVVRDEDGRWRVQYHL